MNKKAVIYARYSSHNQKDASIEQQVFECREYAEEIGLPIIAEYADRAISGTTDKRPQFQQMLKDAEARKFDIVLAWKSNRIGRNMYQAMEIEERLKSYGIKCQYVEEDFDDTAAGRFALRSMMNVNQFYSENMAEDVRRGLRNNALQCKVNGRTPLGYCAGEDKKLHINESEAEIVRDVYNRVALGEPYISIISDLNSKGYKTTRLKRKFTKGSFFRLLRNERYRGIYIYDDIRIEGGIPRIIDDELFFKVQRLLELKNPIQRQTETQYLLTGKLFCGECESPMIGVSGKGKSGRPYYYYACKNAKQHKCKKRPVRKEHIETAVAQVIMDRVLTPETIEWIADKVVEYNAMVLKRGRVAELKESLKDNQTAINNLLKAMEMGIITESTKNRMKELEAEQLDIKRLIHEAEARQYPVTRESVIQGLEMFKSGDIEDAKYRKELFKTFVRAVYVFDDDKLKVLFTFPGSKNNVEIPMLSETESVRTETTKLHQIGCVQTPDDLIWYCQAVMHK